MLEKGVYKADLFADLLKCELPVIFPPKKKERNKIIKNPGFLRFSIADSREI